MRVTDFIATEDMLERLRQVPLRGYPDVFPYAEANLRLAVVYPRTYAVPTQRYVLREGLRRASEMRAALATLGFNMLKLDGGLLIDNVPLLPPIIEQWEHPLVADGMHRLYMAEYNNEPTQVILASALPEEYPYYAYGLPGGWDDVHLFDELPEHFPKKLYRNPTGYKKLFRQYNTVFPGVQADRKKTNPAHLTP